MARRHEPLAVGGVDDARAPELQGSLAARAVHRHHEHAVGDRVAPQHRVPGFILLPVQRFLAVEPADRRGIKEHLRAGHGRQPRGLRIPLVPADERPYLQPAGWHRHEAGVARREIKLLVVVRVVGDVHLAVEARSRTVTIEDHGRVVEEAVRSPLEHAPHEHDIVLACRRGEPLGERTGHGFSLGELSMVFGLAGILPCEEFLQTDHLRAAAGRRGDAFEGLRDVVIAVRRAGRLHQPDPHNASTGVAHLRVRLLRALEAHRPATSTAASSFDAGTGNCSASSATSPFVVAISC